MDLFIKIIGCIFIVSMWPAAAIWCAIHAGKAR